MSMKLQLQIIHCICFTWLTVQHRESVTEKYNNLTIIDYPVTVYVFLLLSCPMYKVTKETSAKSTPPLYVKYPEQLEKVQT